MPLLAEYALTPDVFDATSYSSDEVGSIRLQDLKEVLLAEGIVRDLRDGGWSQLFTNGGRPWHNRGKELLKKLAQQKRLRRFQPVGGAMPASDTDWCLEALASNGVLPLFGIVATPAVAAGFKAEPLVASVDRLPSAPWWAARSQSVRMPRTLAEYTRHLQPVLDCANSIMFIDAHLDPTQGRYRDFLSLLLATAGRATRPLIEAHRVCYFDTRDKRDQLDDAGWRAMFASWAGPLQAAGIAVEAFVWDDFHDRHVISDLIGIQMGNGFDTTADPASVTTWTRLGRAERDDIQREFDPASGRHALKHRFRIP